MDVCGLGGSVQALLIMSKDMEKGGPEAALGVTMHYRAMPPSLVLLYRAFLLLPSFWPRQ